MAEKANSPDESISDDEAESQVLQDFKISFADGESIKESASMTRQSFRPSFNSSKRDEANDKGAASGEELHIPKKNAVKFSPSVNDKAARRTMRVTRMFESINLNRLQQMRDVKPILEYQPTYRLESMNPFKYRVVEDLIEKVVEAHMEAREKITSDETALKFLCDALSDEVLDAVKAKDFDRYRILVSVTAGEKMHQAFHQSVAFLWDSECDAMAKYVFERFDLFVITTVFGIYFD